MTTRFPLLAAGILFASPIFACAPPAASSARALAPTSSETGASWPEFRGPHRDGICPETGLLQSWPAGGPSKLWTADHLGLGFGTPSIAAGKIFGMGTRDGKDGVWALRELDGKELWFTPFDSPRKTNQNNGPSGTPTYNDGKLYSVSSNGKLVCMDAETGKEIWEVDYLKDFDGQVPGWGYTESPLIDGDKVIATPGSAKATVVALDKNTGKVIWKSAIAKSGNGGGYCSPVKANVAGVPMYVILLGKEGGIIGVSPENGHELWRYTKSALGGVAQIPMPIVKGDLVWFSTSYSGGSALLQLIPEGKDKFTVKELKTYAKPDLNNHHGGMVLIGDYIYFGHDQNQGYPVCVEFKTGEIKWGPEKKDSLVAGGKGSAAVLYADHRLYYRYQNGVMVLMEPSPEGLKVISHFKLPDPDIPTGDARNSWAHPVIVNGKLYIRDQNKLYCYNVKADKS